MNLPLGIFSTKFEFNVGNIGIFLSKASNKHNFKLKIRNSVDYYQKL